jgi:hypothetical protein
MSVEQTGPTPSETGAGQKKSGPDQNDPRAIERRREFENVKSPEELLSFMAEHVDYGFVGRNGKVYTHDDKNWDADFSEQYALQSPEELLASQHGVCWDDAELERHWFATHGYNHRTYFMMYAKEAGTSLPTHTFLAYQEGERWCWFEHAFGSQRGIHEYANLEELTDDVKSRHHDYAIKNRGATDDDSACLRLGEYEPPKYGSSAQEFITDIIQRNPQLVEKE